MSETRAKKEIRPIIVPTINTVLGNSDWQNPSIHPIVAAPTSATDTGTAGEIRIVSGFIYCCVSTDVWQRVAIATWV